MKPYFIKYVKFIFIILSSVVATIIVLNVAYMVGTKLMSFQYDCRHMIENMKVIEDRLLAAGIFYLIVFISYFTMFVFILKKLLKTIKTENVIISIAMITIFNMLVIAPVFFMDMNLKQQLIGWCKDTKEMCELIASKTHADVAKSLKECIDNPVDYYNRLTHKL